MVGHVLAAAEHGTGSVLAQADVDGHTNEIARFSPLLDQIPDLRGAVSPPTRCTASVNTSPTWIKVLTLAGGIDFPYAAQAIQIRRRRRRLDQPKRWTTETIYAITDLPTHQGRPAWLAGWIRGHWSIENKIHWVRDVTYDEDRSQIRTAAGAQVMATIRNLAIAALPLTGVTNIAAANRHHARNPNRPLDLLGIT